MNRRSSLKYVATGGIVAALGGGYHWLSKERDHADLSLDRLIGRLNALDVGSIETSGNWDVARTFNHLAQSIEFSMTGFPVQKSALFQNTAGKLAYSVFQANGRMTHALDEEIPGEVIDLNNTNHSQARERLVRSLEQFAQFDQSLQPHFAYGELNKDQYAIAHALHVNNHLEEFRNVMV